MEGSRCLRSVPSAYSGYDINKAKIRCSGDIRCVGIELYDERYFRLCLDAMYMSTAWDKYQNLTNPLLRKTTDYGKL